MSLNSFSFIIFISAVLLVMSALQIIRRTYPKADRIQIAFLLLVSYVFLVSINTLFLICIVAVTVFTYIFGILLQKNHNRTFLIAGVTVLVLSLGFFKYTSFFINSIRSIISFDSVTLNIILPLGISFYIFSSLAYLIDVYRGDYAAETNFLCFALYVSFFPKLTAGPIVRGKDFFPQVKEYRGIRWDAFKIGIQIFVFGLFKKMVLADHLGVFVDDVFYAPTAFDTGTVILATISYSLQIYFDFSGYSDMAIGISKIMGFDFKPNFNLPYIAQNVSEFWKRWHISLSSWLQDYLYIPLGGSRKGKARTYINLMLVMLISGLWHGAGWTFIMWGGLHGLASCVNKAFEKKLKMLGPWVNGIITFFFVSLFWVIFRAGDFSTAMKIWAGLFSIHMGISQPYTWSFFAISCLVIGTITAWRHSRKMGLTNKNGNLMVNGFYPLLDLSKFWSQTIFLTFCGLTIIMGYYGNTAFIYGAF